MKYKLDLIYFKMRALIDVSIEPKLVIDGVAHPTGVKKT